MSLVAAVGGWIYIVIVVAAALLAFFMVRIPSVARWNRRVAPRFYKGLYGPDGERRDAEEQ